MKRWIFDPLILTVAAGAVFLFFILTATLFQQDPTPLLEKAYASYTAGEKAANVADRQKDFNHALEIYSTLEDQYHPAMGNGRLYYNIANTFYQLEAYPWAVLNAYRALALNPRDERIRLNLQQALSKLNLPVNNDTLAFESLLFIHTKLSIPERIQIFTLFTLLAFVSFSLFIWTSGRLWRDLGFILTVLIVMMSGSLAYTYYIAPLEGVIIRSSLLYRDAGTQYAPVSEEPAPSGQKVKILDIADNGNWLKVQIPAGTVGFIPGDALRLIQ